MRAAAASSMPSSITGAAQSGQARVLPTQAAQGGAARSSAHAFCGAFHPGKRACGDLSRHASLPRRPLTSWCLARGARRGARPSLPALAALARPALQSIRFRALERGCVFDVSDGIGNSEPQGLWQVQVWRVLQRSGMISKQIQSNARSVVYGTAECTVVSSRRRQERSSYHCERCQTPCSECNTIYACYTHQKTHSLQGINTERQKVYHLGLGMSQPRAASTLPSDCVGYRCCSISSWREPKKSSVMRRHRVCMVLLRNDTQHCVLRQRDPEDSLPEAALHQRPAIRLATSAAAQLRETGCQRAVYFKEPQVCALPAAQRSPWAQACVQHRM